MESANKAPSWISEIGQEAGYALKQISDYTDRFRTLTNSSFSYRYVLNAQVNTLYDAAEQIKGGSVVFESKRQARILLSAHAYHNGTVPVIFRTLTYASKVGVVRLLETFRSSIDQSDLLSAFLVLRSIIEQVAHFDAVISHLESIEIPNAFKDANREFGEVLEFLNKKAYGTRIDWLGLMKANAQIDELIDANKLKYVKGEKRADRSADQILNAIDKLARRIKGTRAIYEILCEFAHPNVGLLLSCTEDMERHVDASEVHWVEKRLGLGAPLVCVRDIGPVIRRVLQQVSLCLEHYDKLLKREQELHEKLLQIVQIITKNIVTGPQKDMFEKYGPCPCGSGRKLRFCCGRK